MANPLHHAMTGVERVVGVVDKGWRGFWRWFADVPLQHFLFALILTISGIIALVKATFEEGDRLWAGIEKALIGVALLAMTALSFMDYLRREIDFVNVEVQGGPTMAVVLMVWVGFLGASLATRQPPASCRLPPPASPWLPLLPATFPGNTALIASIKQ